MGTLTKCLGCSRVIRWWQRTTYSRAMYIHARGFDTPLFPLRWHENCWIATQSEAIARMVADLEADAPKAEGANKK